ncbi:MAG: DNRLRE domain-containing protein [Bacteroidota bacterium]|nr:DNRLRE domain-containing protein [Bacteroidota bacterium]
MKHLITLVTLLLCASTVAAQSVITLQPGPEQGKDAMVWDDPLYNKAVRNYAEHEEMLVHAWTDQAVPVFARSYISFDLSDITRADLTSAVLTLYNNPQGTFEGQHRPWSGPNRAFVRRVITPWDENTISWNNQPSYTDWDQVMLPASVTGNEDYVIDVTAMVRDMLYRFRDRSHGFAIMLEQEDFYRALVFTTSDYPDPARRPKLELRFAGTSAVEAPAPPSPLKLDIYPNPTSAQVEVYAELPDGGRGYVELLNLAGQVISSWDLHESTLLHIPLTGLASGQYWLRFGTDADVQIKPLIVQ